MKLRIWIFVLTLLASTDFILGQNLVINPAFEDGNTGFTTDYVLWHGGTWGAGAYYITNSPQNAFSAWSAAGDHTTGTGQMLIVDGSGTPDVVFWRQSVPVVTNANYLFSAWMLRFDSDFSPTQYFSINLSPQSPVFPLLTNQPGWQGHGIEWNSGTSTVAVLELRLQTGHLGAGNNLAVDDIAFLKTSDLPQLHLDILATNGTAQISWFSYPGLTYKLQWKTNLNTSTWTDLGSPIEGNGTNIYFNDPISESKRFYRVLY
jgi:hypothetical protein